MPINNKIRKQVTFTQTLFTLQGHLGESEKTVKPINYYYIIGHRNNVAIWNLEKTIPILKQIILLLKTAIQHKETILFIGAQNNKITNNILKNIATQLNQPFITTRWISGLFTNWNSISKTLNNTSIPDKTTKKNKTKLYTTLNLNQKPSFLFIADIKQNKIAITEANKAHIPIIAFVDSDCDSIKVTYPIYINDDSPIILKFFCKLLQKS